MERDDKRYLIVASSFGSIEYSCEQRSLLVHSSSTIRDTQDFCFDDGDTESFQTFDRMAREIIKEQSWLRLAT